MGCAAVIFGVESRVRKSEAAKALCALVESKKNYVRFIRWVSVAKVPKSLWWRLLFVRISAFCIFLANYFFNF